MKSTDQKLEELELRIDQLEAEMRILYNQHNALLKEKNLSDAISPVIPEEEISLPPIQQTKMQRDTLQKASMPSNRTSESMLMQAAEARAFNPKPSAKKTVFNLRIDRESLVGKYLVGAFASLLIFIAAASFTAIIWNRITPTMKVGILTGVGLLLSLFGFSANRKKASPIASIVFGTGIGLMYIAILSSNLIFQLISHEWSIFLCALWTGFILFSYRYTNLFFTLVIAHIGSFVNLLVELNYIESFQDMYLLLLYISGISILLLYIGRKESVVKRIALIHMVACSYFTFFAIRQLENPTLYVIPLGICVLAMWIFKNMLYKIAEKENLRFAYWPLGILSTLCALLFVSLSLKYYWSLARWQALLVFFTLLLIQWLINTVRFKNIGYGLNHYYITLMYLSIRWITEEKLDVSTAAAIILLLIWFQNSFFKTKTSALLLSIFVVLDSFNTGNCAFLGIAILTIALYHHRMCTEPSSRQFKPLQLLLMIIYSFRIAFAFSSCFFAMYPYDLPRTLGYAMATIVTIWFSYKEEKNPSDNTASLTNVMSIYSLMATGLYLLGITFLLDALEAVYKLVLTLTVLANALYQSRFILRRYPDPPKWLGIWLVLKYLILSWTVLYSFLSLSINSATYSIVGLLLAALAIYIGFRTSIRVIRQFGLGITMLMVAKFIIVDLQGENSITRVLAFVAGGVLCFIISIIYNHLSKE